MFILYVLPGACSLASHIALEQAADTIPETMPFYEVIVMPRGQNHGPDYRIINNLGTVPALISGGSLIVESMAVLLHIADLLPDARLAPVLASSDRDRAHTLLSTMVTNGHTSFQMLWRSERFADSDDGRADLRRKCEARLDVLFSRFETLLVGDYLIGDTVTIADTYLYVLCRWGLRLPKPTTSFQRLWRFTKRMASLPSAARAMAREGIILSEPSSGLG
jgi:glutathione S-transferase